MNKKKQLKKILDRYSMLDKDRDFINSLVPDKNDLQFKFIDITPLEALHGSEFNNIDTKAVPTKFLTIVKDENGYPINSFKTLEYYTDDDFEVSEAFNTKEKANFVIDKIVDIVYELLPFTNNQNDNTSYVAKVTPSGKFGFINKDDNLLYFSFSNGINYRAMIFYVIVGQGQGWYNTMNNYSKYNNPIKIYKFAIAAKELKYGTHWKLIKTKEDIRNNVIISCFAQENLPNNLNILLKSTDTVPININYDNYFINRGLCYGYFTLNFMYYNSTKDGNNYRTYKPISVGDLGNASLKIGFVTDDYNDVDYIIIKNKQIIEIHKVTTT